MAGFDKWVMTERLKGLGWAEVESDDPALRYHMVPPESLFTNRPKSFYVYDAKDLQDMLGELTDPEAVEHALGD